MLATGGNAFLGGDDFDNRLIDFLVSEFKSESGIDLKNDVMALQRLKEAAENAKKELSSAMETTINLPFITADATGPKHLTKTISRAKFEGLIDDLVSETITKINEVVKDANISIDKKVEGIRLIKSGDSWIFYDIEGNIKTFESAKISLGSSNTILFLEDIENDGKMIPAHYDIDDSNIHIFYTNYDGEYRYIKLQASSIDDVRLGIANHYIGTVDSLPTLSNEGDIVKLSTDKTFYLYDGTAWSAFDKASEVDLSNYLAKNNTITYKPATDYNPATKKYVDDSITTTVGDINTILATLTTVEGGE